MGVVAAASRAGLAGWRPGRVYSRTCTPRSAAHATTHTADCSVVVGKPPRRAYPYHNTSRTPQRVHKHAVWPRFCLFETPPAPLCLRVRNRQLAKCTSRPRDPQRTRSLHFRNVTHSHHAMNAAAAATCCVQCMPSRATQQTSELDKGEAVALPSSQLPQAAADPIELTGGIQQVSSTVATTIQPLQKTLCWQRAATCSPQRLLQPRCTHFVRIAIANIKHLRETTK